MESFVPQLFKDDADPEVMAWVIEQAVASDQAATIALMRAFAGWEAPAAMSAAGAPIRCINAAPEGERGLATEIAINRKYADFDAVLMEGVGHYPQLERPGEFNERLLAALQELAGRSRVRATRSPGRPRPQTP
jgi:pimeloyl-ACP methyl ester carboxylesterase